MAEAPQPVTVRFPAEQEAGGELVELSAQRIPILDRHLFNPSEPFRKQAVPIIESARGRAACLDARWLGGYLRVNFSASRPWSGVSYGLALVLADIHTCLEIRPTRHLYATGVIGQAGEIRSVTRAHPRQPPDVESFRRKLELMKKIPDPRHSTFFYPREDEALAVDDLQALRVLGIQTHAVAHVDEILALVAPADAAGTGPQAAPPSAATNPITIINHGLMRFGEVGRPDPRTIQAPLLRPPMPTRVIDFRVTGLPHMTRLHLASAHGSITLGRDDPADKPSLPLQGAARSVSARHLCITHRGGHWLLSDPRPRERKQDRVLTEVSDTQLLPQGSARLLDDGDRVDINQGRMVFTVRLDEHWLCFDIDRTRYLLIAAPVELGGGCLPLPEAHTRCASLAPQDGGFTVTALAPGMTINEIPLTAGQCAGLQIGDQWRLGGIGLRCEQ